MSSPPSTTSSVAKEALRLLDQRRIRRQAITRDFDLAPDDEADNLEFLKYQQQQQSEKEQQSQETTASPHHHHHQKPVSTATGNSTTTTTSFSSASPTTNNNNVNNINTKSSAATDFRLFGRLIAASVFRDRTRHYLLTDFHRMNGNKNDSNSSCAEAVDEDIIGVLDAQTGTIRKNRRKNFEKFVEETKKHRKLLDAAIGELSTDLMDSSEQTGIIAETSAADGRYRKLVRSCDAAVIESIQRDVMETRKNLPFPIRSTTMYCKGAFPDRPPSPRTLRLQTRRVRLGELLKISSDYSHTFLDPFSGPTSMFWMFKYLLKGGSLTPRSTFFFNFKKESSSSTSSSSQPQLSNHNLCITIAPKQLSENLRHLLPWRALTETEIDWLMSQLAPDYQACVDSNREAAKRAKNPSLLVSLARSRRDQAGANALDHDLRKILRKFEEECKIETPPNEPIDFELALKRLLTVLRDTYTNNNNNTHGDDDDDDDDEQMSMALLCYSALLPKSMRTSRAIMSANASSPPPALLREWLALASQEYSAVGEDEMASLVQRFAMTWHVHFSHIACGIDTHYMVLETTKQRETTTVTSPAAKRKKSSNPDHHHQQKPVTFVEKQQPCALPLELAEYAGLDHFEKQENVREENNNNDDNEEEEVLMCPVCSLSSMIDSNYSYIDATSIMSHIRNEARGDLVRKLEKFIIKKLDRLKSGELVDSRNNRNPLEDQEENNNNFANDDDEHDDEDGNNNNNNNNNSEKKKSIEDLLVDKSWRFDLLDFPLDLNDFKNAVESREKNVSSSSSSSSSFSRAAITNQYFDVFVTHFTSCPQFASLMASLMLKQLYILCKKS